MRPDTLLGILSGPLMIEPRAYSRLVDEARVELEMFSRRNMGETPPSQTAPAKLSTLYDCESMGQIDQEDLTPKAPGSMIAVVPIVGTISRHGYSGWLSSRPGSVEIGREMQRLYNDESIGAIVLFVNSPGGQVWGTPELARTIYDLREDNKKRIIACVDPMMASAATYIATAAHEVFCIESGDCGSVGVISSYSDWSEYLKKAGINIEYIRIPDKKARFTGDEPMTDDMRASMKKSVQESYDLFVRDMARNRKCSTKVVEEKFGGGEMMSAMDAVNAGLIDGIKTLDEVIAELATNAVKSKRDYMRKRAEERLKAAKEATVPVAEGEATASA